MGEPWEDDVFLIALEIQYSFINLQVSELSPKAVKERGWERSDPAEAQRDREDGQGWTQTSEKGDYFSQQSHIRLANDKSSHSREEGECFRDAVCR